MVVEESAFVGWMCIVVDVVVVVGAGAGAGAGVLRNLSRSSEESVRQSF